MNWTFFNSSLIKLKIGYEVYKKRISAEKMYLTTDIPMGKSTSTLASSLDLQNVMLEKPQTQLQSNSFHFYFNTNAPSNSSLNIAISNIGNCDIKSKYSVS